MTDLTRKFINFVDAHIMIAKYPDRFEVLTTHELNSLSANDYVKVGAAGEGFWCQILSVDGVIITARVDNDLVRTHRHGIMCDDIVRFEKRHVYQILRSGALAETDNQKTLH